MDPQRLLLDRRKRRIAELELEQLLPALDGDITREDFERFAADLSAATTEEGRALIERLRSHLD